MTRRNFVIARVNFVFENLMVEKRESEIEEELFILFIHDFIFITNNIPVIHCSISTDFVINSSKILIQLHRHLTDYLPLPIREPFKS